MAQLKVYGGLLYNPHKRQERVICAVNSQKELREIVDRTVGVGHVSLRWIRDYWCLTGNAKEIGLALAKPHQLIWTGRT